jgi:beta-lactamase class A
MSKQLHTSSSDRRSFLSRKIPLGYTLVLTILVAVASFYVTRIGYITVHAPSNEADSTQSDRSEYQIKRLSNFKFIRPLLSAKPVEEYDGYSRIKKSVLDLMQYYQNQGVLASASLYMRDFDKSNWTAINQNERFHPGSIMKIPVLMTMLKSEEEHPGYIDSTMQFTFRFKYATPKKQSITSKQIEFGRRYSRCELLKYMIEYSDNNASELLWMTMNKNTFTEMFREFGLATPDLHASEIPLSAQECSLFLETLFNATYLNIKQSEFAIDLLSKSTFSDGIVKGIPVGKLLIAHKFGESGSDRNRELHETGLLYIDDRPYLITIMTRGQDNVDYAKLATVLQGVSRTVYYGLTEKDHK